MSCDTIRALIRWPSAWTVETAPPSSAPARPDRRSAKPARRIILREKGNHTETDLCGQECGRSAPRRRDRCRLYRAAGGCQADGADRKPLIIIRHPGLVAGTGRLQTQPRADLGLDRKHPEAAAAGGVDEAPGGIVITDSGVDQGSVVEIGHLARARGVADVEDPEARARWPIST